jgi:hypothetical protein
LALLGVKKRLSWSWFYVLRVWCGKVNCELFCVVVHVGVVVWGLGFRVVVRGGYIKN